MSSTVPKPISKSLGFYLFIFYYSSIPLASHRLHPYFGLPCLFTPPASARQACFWSPSIQGAHNFLPEHLPLGTVLGNNSNISAQRSVPQRNFLGKGLEDEVHERHYLMLSSKTNQSTNRTLFRIPNVSS